MYLSEFLDEVMPTIGTHCQGPPGGDSPEDSCLAWADHFCTDSDARCLRHCTCTPGPHATPHNANVGAAS